MLPDFTRLEAKHAEMVAERERSALVSVLPSKKIKDTSKEHGLDKQRAAIDAWADELAAQVCGLSWQCLDC